MQQIDKLKSSSQEGGLTEILKKYKHALWGLYVPFYLAAFFLIEHFITDNYWVSYLPLDDKIPFIEQFVIAYYLWYPALFAVGIYLILFDAPAFRRYMWFIMIGFSASIVICALFPNGQDLRPVAFERDNVFTDLVGAIYSVDTNTNVLPSIHVVGAMATTFGVFDCPKLRRPWICVCSIVLTLLINISTVLIKQHSILDVYAGLAFSAIVFAIVYLPRYVKSAKSANNL